MKEQILNDVEAIIDSNNCNAKIGKIIRNMRQKRGLSQQQIASKLGITAPAFSKIESGLTDVNFSRLTQIAQVFNVTVIELICYERKIDDDMDVEELGRLKVELAKNKAEIIDLQKKLIKQLEKGHI
ncbi:MAG: helix-turn-helix domain-containing protein [Solitalea-like symbiont of Acarus siro]